MRTADDVVYVTDAVDVVQRNLAIGAVLALIHAAGRREELLGRLWGVFGSKSGSRTVDMHVARLRAKLGDDGAQPNLIVTVRGKGYLFAGEGEGR